MTSRARIPFHPAADLFPLMDTTELEGLTASIKDVGIQVPILLYEGKIIDGRNRYRACLAADVDPKFEQASFSCSPEEYVASLNLERRHLTTTQRAMIAAEIKRRLAKAAKERQREGAKAGGQSGGSKVPANLPEGLPSTSSKPPSERESRTEAARIMNVSPRSVQAADTVLKRAAPELKSAVAAGKIPVSVAAKLTTLPEAKQREVAAAPKEQVRQAAKAALPAAPAATPRQKLISVTFYNALKDIVARISGIRDQYGSVTEMFASPLWAGQDIYPVVELVHEVQKEFTQWDKEMQRYVSKHGHQKPK